MNDGTEVEIENGQRFPSLSLHFEHTVQAQTAYIFINITAEKY